MTHPQRHAIAAATAAMAATLLLAACTSSSSPAAHAKTLTSAAVKTGGAAGASSANSASTAPPSVATSQTAVTSACALVTEKEVGTVLGSDPGPGSPFSSHGASQCQYGSYQTALVLVNLNPTMGKAAYDHMRGSKIGQAGAVADVPGLGDRAFGISGPNTASIYINAGDALVLVMVAIRAATSAPMGQARALAAIATSRA